MRGEHSSCSVTHSTGTGSSPHARGALDVVADGQVLQGIIPACAGSTLVAGRADRVIRDHPRMRGEHSRPTVTTLACVGSSPHARGALGRTRMMITSLGIIPACAGSTNGDG